MTMSWSGNMACWVLWTVLLYTIVTNMTPGHQLLITSCSHGLEFPGPLTPQKAAPRLWLRHADPVPPIGLLSDKTLGPRRDSRHGGQRGRQMTAAHAGDQRKVSCGGWEASGLLAWLLCQLCHPPPPPSRPSCPKCGRHVGDTYRGMRVCISGGRRRTANRPGTLATRRVACTCLRSAGKVCQACKNMQQLLQAKPTVPMEMGWLPMLLKSWEKLTRPDGVVGLLEDIVNGVFRWMGDQPTSVGK
jgi:hypothetical protein